MSVNPERESSNVVRVNSVLADLIPQFFASVRDDVATIRDALASDDFDTIVRVGHNIKGAGGGYGFAVISDIGAIVNRAANERDATKITQQLEQLTTFLEQVEIVYE